MLYNEQDSYIVFSSAVLRGPSVNSREALLRGLSDRGGYLPDFAVGPCSQTSISGTLFSAPAKRPMFCV